MPKNRTKPNKPNGSFTDAQLLKLARHHFAHDFPNPKRLGCPPSNQLKVLADRPLSAPDSVLSHISFCSPCYRAFSQFSQARKRKLRSSRRNART